MEASGPELLNWSRIIPSTDGQLFRVESIQATRVMSKHLGLGGTFVTSTRTPANVIYHVVKGVFDNFDQFKKNTPSISPSR
ncbi:MAG: hypothetical protein CM1200mP30_18900 [Pseudomonadota bacterium]|nr:MAG: hypothetical protein CM1200mP30_18900 [Pseudomonadota bacterium]